MSATYDDIIVGAGSAGAVLAARLSEDPARSVLVLDAGPDYPSVAATPADLRDSTWISVVDHDWGFKAGAVKGREIEFPRGKVTGGSSAVNGTIALRGVPADYDEWAALGSPDWSWAKVLPYFRKLEDDQDEGGEFHGTGGPIPIRRWRRPELLALQRACFDAVEALRFPVVRDHNHPEEHAALHDRPGGFHGASGGDGAGRRADGVCRRDGAGAAAVARARIVDLA